ncbi:fimbrial major subunit CsuA/B family protein [Gluconacetobacter tumulisoli]|uniref:Fimbrial major subunit CsuA/B family protein n=2 Tax=Gluconacetobacter tumulisoli TaxID=1286189 RepID=A0A7W4K539_9PROT|nr:fimbrial major subunit CsuA/B family protein [Gluconacetobacter tumulisoli]
MAAGFLPMTPSPAGAATINGTVEAHLALTSACSINGAAPNDGSGTGSVDFGTLEFGTQTSLFSQADGQVTDSGTQGIAIQCTPGTDATLTFVSGANDTNASAGHVHALTDGNSHYVPYDIFATSQRTTPLANAGTVLLTADGTQQAIPLYGRAYGAAGLAAGTYADTISVTLTF